jgi:hypothetical protein
VGITVREVDMVGYSYRVLSILARKAYNYAIADRRAIVPSNSGKNLEGALS